MRRFITIATRAAAFAALAAALAFAAQVSAEPYHERERVQSYIGELVSRYSFERDTLEQLFRAAEKQEDAIEAMDRPAEAKPWHAYRDIFLTRERVRAGASYWREHRETLQRAAKRYGVPAEIILAIIGVETYYGRITGGFPVFDTLVTLGFDYPRRARFFLRELTEFLLLCREEKMDCAEVRGSYAGAMGLGQFIPSSYRAYAVDFDGDGARDLWDSPADAIGSIANFLVRHGWRGRAPLGEYVAAPEGDYKPLLNRKMQPWLSASDLDGRGIRMGGFMPREEKFSLFDFQHEGGRRKTWVGYQNFFVLTRYNTSRRYALAVHQLAQQIHGAYRPAEQ